VRNHDHGAGPGRCGRRPGFLRPNLRAWVVYLLVFQHIPVARVVELVADLSGAHPSAGWASRVLRDTAAALADVEKLICALLTAAHILHVDETGAKVTGARWWLHVAATEHLTAYHLDTSRGRTAIDTFAVLDGFAGTLVHDCWASYNAYTHCQHALCGAHIARELIAAAETHPNQHWPTQAVDTLFALNTAAHTAATTATPESHLRPPTLCCEPGATPSESAWPNIPADPPANNPRPATSWNAYATARPTYCASPTTCPSRSPTTKLNVTCDPPKPK
jgi:hypothetical protein